MSRYGCYDLESLRDLVESKLDTPGRSYGCCVGQHSVIKLLCSDIDFVASPLSQSCHHRAQGILVKIPVQDIAQRLHARLQIAIFFF